MIIISVNHLKKDKRQRKERHSHKIYHDGTIALTCESWLEDHTFPNWHGEASCFTQAKT